MTAKRAAIYARVSTAEQVEGTSLAIQVAQCEHLLSAQGWSLQGTFIDEGVSGAKARRPALDALLTEIRNGAIDVVAVAKLDRIGRSMRHLAALLGELDDRGVVLVSVSESFDSSTPAGRLQRNMLGSFAEFEREQIRERLSAGRDATIRQGKYVSTHAPYGLRIEAEGGNRRLVLDATEADTLRLLLDLFVNHRFTTGQVAAELNARGMRPRRSPRWTGHSVRALLRNADYISGTWTWRHPRHRYKGPPITMTVPGIIDATTHKRLQARLADTTQNQAHPRRGRRSERYLLGGRIYTPHGTLMYGLHNPSAMYRCSEVFANNAPPGGRSCNCRPIRAEHIEAQVWSEVCTLLSDPTRLIAMAGIRLTREEANLTSNTQDLAAIDKRIGRLEKAAGEQLSRLLSEGLDPTVASHAAKDLTQELAAARRHRDQIASWHAANADRHNRVQRLAELAKRARQILPVADTATKQRILALLDLQVRVVTWQPCITCHGVGYISNPASKTDQGLGRPRGNADKICPACRRHRWIPQIVIQGSVPESDFEDATAGEDTAGWPFKLVAGEG